MPAPAATSEEIGEVLGDVDESIIERLIDTGASLEELGEAVDDLDHERRFGEERLPSSPMIAQVRSILEELPQPSAEVALHADLEDEEEEDEGLTIVNGEHLRS